VSNNSRKLELAGRIFGVVEVTEEIAEDQREDAAKGREERFRWQSKTVR